MAITNEQAMQDLNRLKLCATKTRTSDYWHGVFIGSAGAYLRANVITLDQYTTLTKLETEVSAT